MPQLHSAPFAAAASKIVHQIADARRAEEREKGHPVHRDAIDYLDLEARRPRRLNPASYADELDQHRALLDVIETWQAESVAEGATRYRGVFGLHGIATFRALLDDMARSGDGRSDLAYAQIAAATGQARSTVYNDYHTLIDAGVIDYQPRSIAAGVDGRGKHLRVQMSSVAWLTPCALPRKWQALFKSRLAFYQARRQDAAMRREAAERRRLAQARMQDLCAMKADKARDGGTPARQSRPIRAFDPHKVNPAGMRRLDDADAARALEASEEEQRDADRVRANLADLLASMIAQGT